MLLSFKTVIQNDKYISCSIIYIFVWGKKKSWGEKYVKEWPSSVMLKVKKTNFNYVLTIIMTYR
jgi:hypothetical protein